MRVHLWAYKFDLQQWILLHGTNAISVNPSYGVLNVANFTNTPGCRRAPVMKMGPSQTLWMYGGHNSELGKLGAHY